MLVLLSFYYVHHLHSRQSQLRSERQ